MFAALLSSIGALNVAFLNGASLADAAPASPVGSAAGGLSGMFNSFMFPLILIYGVFWFMWLGPKRKEQKALTEWIKNLNKGDEVVTTGGLIGKVTGLTDQTVTLEVQEKVRLKVVRSSIAGKAPSATAQSSIAGPAIETKPATK